MAFAGMSPRNPYGISASFAQSRQDKFGVHPAGAGNAYHANIRRVLHAADTRQISGAVTAPVAKECDDFGFPI
jgi:hypothetical protein